MAEDIYGPSIPHLKGKPVKITSVPKTIIFKYEEVTIYCDLVHINEIVFLNTIS